MTKFRLYVEGGGDNASQKRLLRIAIGRLLERGLVGRHVYGKPKLEMCGSIERTLKRFHADLSTKDDAVCGLLVDSDGPVAPGRGAAAHVAEKRSWVKPIQSTDEQIHLMVQTMEAWIVADRDALQAYYGNGFRPNFLSNRENVEEIPKAELESGLNQATLSTEKGSYHKIKHACQLLPRLDATKVAARAKHFKRLLDFLAGHLR